MPLIMFYVFVFSKYVKQLVILKVVQQILCKHRVKDVGNFKQPCKF